MKERETKSFSILIKESIISELFKILNCKGNKKFRTEIITPSFFVSFWNQLSVFFPNRIICMFCHLYLNLVKIQVVINHARTHTHPHPARPRQKKVILTVTHPKKVTPTYTHPHPAKTRSHLPTSIHTQSKKVKLTLRNTFTLCI